MRSLLPVSLFLAPIGLLPAQNDVVVPRVAAGFEGNDIGQVPFGRTGFRTQIVIDGMSIAQTGAVINGIGFRPDNDNSIGSAAVTINNVTIDLSHTNMSPVSMSTTFANNITGTPMNVFSGNVSLPAYTSTSGAVAPFAVIATTPFPYVVSSGNLLIDITAANAGSTSTGWIPDSSLPGGGVVRFGTAGQQTDPLTISVSANTTQGRFAGIAPGGSMTYVLTTFNSSVSGGLLLGLSRLPGIDLTSIGAPGNRLYVNPAIVLPFTTVPSGFQYRSNFPLTLPNDPTLIGGEVVTQCYVLDSITPAGIAMTEGNAVRIGETGHPMRQLRNNDYTQAGGTFSYTGTILGGAVVQLSGMFN